MNSSSRRQSDSGKASQSQQPSKMSMLAMVGPPPHAPFRRDYAWEETRPMDVITNRPRTDTERIALPSIRQAFPELQLRIAQDGAVRAPPATTSPVLGLPGAVTPPEYVHSPRTNKRRRASIDDEERDERSRQVPRLYTSPGGITIQRQGASPIPAPRSATDSWVSSSRTSPYLPSSAGMPSMRSPAAMEPVTGRNDGGRPALPSLPPLSFDGDSQATARTPGLHPVGGMSPMDAGNSAYRHTPSYAYGYHHPTRGQSLSLGSIHHFDRTPFSSMPHGPYQEYMRMGDYGGMVLGNDNKQRKRRGNLPKEITDKLRAWFMAHLHHPYPTEDEKQELMRQTGLQMS